MNRLAVLRWLLSGIRGLLPVLGVSVLARVLQQLLGVALLVVAAAAVVAAEPPTWALAGWLVGIALVKAALRYLEQYAGHWVAFTALQRLRELFFARLAPQAPAATQGRAGAELTERATRDIDRVEVFFAHTMPPAISAVAVPAIALLWLGAAVDARLALVLAPFAAAAIALPFLAGGASWRGARAVAARRGALAARIGDDLQGIREVLGFGIQHARLDALDGADRALTAARSRDGALQGVRTACVTALLGGSLVAVLAVAADGADALLALAVAAGLWTPIRGVDAFASGLDTAFAAAARVREVVEAQPLVRDDTATTGAGPAGTGPAGSAPPAASAPGIVLDRISLTYPGRARPALDAVSLQLAAGDWSTIVGVSGSGKSSLGALLLRGWDPDAGTVSLDGVPLTALPLDALRRRVALAPQQPVLLSGTVASNLRLAAPDADDARLLDALRTVALDDWLAGLPAGLDTPLRERGVDVSGGQRQRIALARALVAEPEVLVLDEALSQLDGATAATVRARLLERHPGLTVVEITHRADLVPDGSPVVVLDAGRVLETGLAGALRATGGAFASIEARAR
ncbi:ABC transporter ATP-binding protein [Arenivirga flava]|uniref:ABC transporter n=1 Tax=Arenivirga flava TaxID=1930060 RepID=A0AA37UQW9_9MICO|nr:ABC transporter ATP-binding protein [Arenivirga flava]GMA27202.1 ABC transporter [Arenivirga flava]